MALSAIELDGAPDDLIGTPDAKGAVVQAMQIELSQTVLDELLECTRSGKPPQILFGRNPVSIASPGGEQSRVSSLVDDSPGCSHLNHHAFIIRLLTTPRHRD
jgi:hypothetical protein